MTAEPVHPDTQATGIGVPGVYLLPVTIPIPALQSVNVYAFDLADGSLGLVDTGWDDDESWHSLVKGLAGIGRSVADVSVVAVTHAHPDHIGLAKRIQDVSCARILLHEQEHARLGREGSGTRSYVAAAREAFRRWGIESDQIEEWIGAKSGVLVRSWDVETVPVRDGELLDFPGWRLRVVWTPGHSHGHMCLYEEIHRLLFTGDHVLSRITPGIGVHPAESGDPLSEYLTSLERVARLDIVHALPGHETAFDDVPARVSELRAHHRARLHEIVAVVEGRAEPTTWEVASRLTWSRPLAGVAPAARRLALLETQAHLVHLERNQTLNRSTDPSARVERWSLA
jgi:glyoxylase-like metal-dependent hydrolase (beta-lactamase superfamily II)